MIKALKNQQLGLKQARLLDRIREDKGYRLGLDVVDPPRFNVTTDDYPIKGEPEDKVTVVEFSDDQCPHCKNALAVVNKLLSRYADQVRLVLRDYPIKSYGYFSKVC